MNPLIYAIPVVVVIAIVLIAMPGMQKKAKEIGKTMEVIRNMKIHLSMAAGNLVSVNGEAVETLINAGAIYGLEMEGDMDVEFTPHFTYANTVYKSRSPMHVQFKAEAGKSYEIVFAPKEPTDMTNVLDVRPIVNKELIFKTTFYIITKDITDTQGAKVMRGVM